MRIKLMKFYLILFCIILYGTPALGNCRGLFYEERVKCLEKEYKNIDNILNNEWKQVSEAIPPEKFKNLKIAQRAWIKFRDANCNCISMLEASGKVDYKKCQIIMTQYRINELRSMTKLRPMLWRAMSPNPIWLTWTVGEKSGGMQFIPHKKKSVLDNFIEDAMEIHYDLKWMVEHEDLLQKHSIQPNET